MAFCPCFQATFCRSSHAKPAGPATVRRASQTTKRSRSDWAWWGPLLCLSPVYSVGAGFVPAPSVRP